MLTEESYQMAWLIYVGAAAMAILCMYLWWFARLGGRLRLTLVLLLAVLMLTPARPGEDIDSLAPAIVVAGFDLLTDGPETALDSFMPVARLCLLALVPALLWTAIRRRRQSVTETPEGA